MNKGKNWKSIKFGLWLLIFPSLPTTILRYIGRHKYIVSLLGIIDNDIHPGIILEYGELGNLQNFINRNCFDTGITGKIRICSQMAEAIEHIHKMDVVHGDIRPENILV